jgi:hypothetical protein
MSENQLDYQRIRRRAEKRVKKRAEFVQHLAIYVVANVLLWIMFLVMSAITHNPEPLIAPMLSTLGWGIGVAIHGIVTFAESPTADAIRERAIEREIRREVERMDGIAVSEKPKREQAMRLSDDGELVVDDAESTQARKSSKG